MADLRVMERGIAMVWRIQREVFRSVDLRKI